MLSSKLPWPFYVHNCTYWGWGWFFLENLWICCILSIFHVMYHFKIHSDVLMQGRDKIKTYIEILRFFIFWYIIVFNCKYCIICNLFLYCIVETPLLCYKNIFPNVLCVKLIDSFLLKLHFTLRPGHYVKSVFTRLLRIKTNVVSASTAESCHL